MGTDRAISDFELVQSAHRACLVQSFEYIIQGSLFRLGTVYDGATYISGHTNRHSHSEAVCHTNCHNYLHAITHEHFDSDANSDTNAHADTHGDAYENPDAERDRVSIANALTDADVHNRRAAQGISADDHPFKLEVLQ